MAEDGKKRTDVLRGFFANLTTRELLDLKKASDADGVDHLGQLYAGIVDGTLTY